MCRKSSWLLCSSLLNVVTLVTASCLLYPPARSHTRTDYFCVPFLLAFLAFHMHTMNTWALQTGIHNKIRRLGVATSPCRGGAFQLHAAIRCNTMQYVSCQGRPLLAEMCCKAGLCTESTSLVCHPEACFHAPKSASLWHEASFSAQRNGWRVQMWPLALVHCRWKSLDEGSEGMRFNRVAATHRIGSNLWEVRWHLRCSHHFLAHGPLNVHLKGSSHWARSPCRAIITDTGKVIWAWLNLIEVLFLVQHQRRTTNSTHAQHSNRSDFVV